MDAAAQIQEAKRRLLAGGVVAFPTETVYGLGALALNADAVARVFSAKGRPTHNPLIVHVSGASMARRLVGTRPDGASMWDDRAERLARAFWPGPLSLVLPKADIVPAIVTGGGPNVALRCPDHPLTLALLFDLNEPIVGPSANRSGFVSPTTAEHVRSEFEHARSSDPLLEVLVLDSRGSARVGVESTVLSLVDPTPRVLRLGVISPEQIAEVLGIEVAAIHVGLPGASVSASGNPRDGLGASKSPGSIDSPGMLDRHYAPRTPARLMTRPELLSLALSPEHTGSVVLCFAPLDGLSDQHTIQLPRDPEACAAALYAALRLADDRAIQLSARQILIEHPPAPETAPADPHGEWVWRVVLDRLRRATAPV